MGVHVKERPKTGRKRWWFVGGTLLYLLSKGKVLLSLLKFGKFGGALLSMFASIGAYALIFPWQFAVGLVMMILIHEMGHVIAARRKGLPVTAPLFIPFIGALINMKRHPRDAVTEAYIAMGGPLLGTLGAVVAFLIGWRLNSPFMLLIAYVGFFINLINLLPIHPLDGGRISTAVTRWLWLVGLIGGLVVIFYLRNILFMLIWTLFAFELYGKFVKRRGRGKPYRSYARIAVPLDRLMEQGVFLPGEGHRRDLDFNTFSTLEGQQKVVIHWPALGIEQTIALPTQGLIERVHVYRIEYTPKEDPQELVVHCEIGYEFYENDRYYEVPGPTRLKYGFAYGGLALFLVWMMYLVHAQGVTGMI